MAEDLAATTVRCRASDSDLYAALMLSDLLENKESTPIEQTPKAPDTPPNEEEEEEDFTNVIWVPADKHPQIAPTEFAKFIQNTSIPIRRANSLHRQKSILSQSQTSQDDEQDEQDDEDLKRTLSEKKRAFLKRISAENERLALDSKTHVFDRNSTAYDNSRIIAPRTDRSLLRRSAFSARGRGRKSNVESIDHENSRKKRQSRVKRENKTEATTKVVEADNAKSVPWDKSEGVVLYDQPVNMSEWIDLGSASLESDDSQRGILSRVHDAESQLRSQINQEEKEVVEEVVEEVDDISTKESKVQVVQVEVDKPNILSLPQQVSVQEGPKRPTMKRTSESSGAVIVNKQEKRSSWLTNLFQDKKNKKTPTTATTTAIQINTSSSPLSSLATLFTKSLSIKSNATNSNLSSYIQSSTLATEEQQGNNKKKRSSRLEIPPPSQRTFFNTNRLPLHVERAIYRLSHIKLANPKRPLSQQVLISNLMFWYLSIQQNDHQIQQQQQQQIPDYTIEPAYQHQHQEKKNNSKMMSRLIHSAKKGKIAPPTKRNNVQFNLPSIPSHHPNNIEDEEDNVPLSHFKN